MMKQIIGYKLNGTVSKEIVDKVLGTKMSEWENRFYFVKGHLGGSLVQEAKRLEILDKWFEPVYEKEWEILSFRNKSFDSIWTKRDDGNFKLIYGQQSPESFFLRNLDKYEIYSIRRTEDNEVFTVGERILYAGEIRTITSFRLEKNNFMVVVFPNAYCAYENAGFKYMQKIKPLFTTQDGKEIYDGDRYWEVNRHELKILIEEGRLAQWSPYKSEIYTPNWIAFSSREAAEKYIEEQKPKVLLRTEDGVQYFEHNRNDIVYGVCIKGLWEAKDIKVHYASHWATKRDVWKFFSSPYQRDEYILRNKPALSLTDVILQFPGMTIDKLQPLAQKVANAAGIKKQDSV